MRNSTQLTLRNPQLTWNVFDKRADLCASLRNLRVLYISSPPLVRRGQLRDTNLEIKRSTKRIKFNLWGIPAFFSFSRRLCREETSCCAVIICRSRRLSEHFLQHLGDRLITDYTRGFTLLNLTNSRVDYVNQFGHVHKFHAQAEMVLTNW